MADDSDDVKAVMDAARREFDRWQRRAERAEDAAGAVITTSVTLVVLGITGYGLTRGTEFRDNPYADWSPWLFLAALVGLYLAIGWASMARVSSLRSIVALRRSPEAARYRENLTILNTPAPLPSDVTPASVAPTNVQSEAPLSVVGALLTHELLLCSARRETAHGKERTALLAQWAFMVAVGLLATAAFLLIWPFEGRLL
jgi:hypothetical protein